MLNIFSSKAKKEAATKLQLAKKLNGQALKCVTERINGIEEIIAKDGAIIFKENHLIVYAGQNIVVDKDIKEISFGELLSLEGLVVTVTNEATNEERIFIAYYKYWRNLNS